MADTPTPAAEKPAVEPVDFVHLHAHTEYSALDGACKIGKLPERLDELGMDTMAVTDHGNIQCWPAFEKAMKKAGKKAIFGTELYLTPDRFDRRKETPTYHLTVLVENNVGLQNLMKISTYAFTEGLSLLFGRARPRADYDLLAKYSEGLIAFTGCMAAPAMSAIFRGDLTTSKAEVEKLIAIFGKDNVFGEIQNVGIEEQIPAYSELAYKLGRQGQNMPDEFSAQQRKEWEQRLELVSARQIAQDPELQRIEAIMARTAPLTQNDANRELAEICAVVGIELVATGDLHYLREGDAFNHDAMICLGTGQIPQRGNRKFSLLPQRYHMRSEAEMLEALGEWPEAIANTRKIADRCNASIVYNKELLPKFPLPEDRQQVTVAQRDELFAFLKEGALAGGLAGAEEYELKERNVEAAVYLMDLCKTGLCTRLGVASYDEAPQEYRERLAFELAVVHKMGFDDYYLVTWDLYIFAHEQKIPAGPGRGSAAGSLAAYCLEITQLDPLKYNLLFERFLNPDRISMPDMDLDYSQEQLEKMREYARRKYNPIAGSDTGVSQIITFSTFKAKNALKDSARVLAEPSDDGKQDSQKLGNQLAGIVPGKPPNITLKEVWEGDSGLKAAYNSNPKAAEAIKLAGWLEGMVKTYGQHAAAVIIGDHPLEEDVPLQIQVRKDERVLTTQWEMRACEEIGLLKMDFLGLRNLDIIDHTLDKLRHSRNVDLGNLKQLYTTLPMDDEKTYQLYQRGETVGTFQFESGGMRSALAEVRPTEFTDLIALVALYRPGPMQNIPHYAARKHKREQVVYPDPRVAGILGETYAITVYQEQSMLISQALAGFTKGQADELRKAIGKKLRDKMAALKVPFIEGCLANGVPKKIAEELWDDNERSADYSFNKSHAACYAFVAYCTGYLKAHYPEEYMASLLSSVMDKTDKMRPYLSEAKRMGLHVLPPDVNRSLRDFAVYEREDKPGEYEILFGLTALKGVGPKVVDLLRDERKATGPFESIYDLIRRLHHELNVGEIQALVKAGALDSTGATRKAMHDVVKPTLEAMKKQIKDKEKAFVKGVKSQAETVGLLGAPLLFEQNGKRSKWSPDAKLVIEGCASACWADRDKLEDAALVQCAEEALLKDELRLARAEAKRDLAENAEHATSIAEEEGEVQDAKTLIEEAAQRTVAGTLEARQAKARELGAAVKPFIAAELDARSELEGLEEAMADQADTTLSSEEWDHIEKLNYEREVLGIYVTGHPLDRDSHKWARYVSRGIGEIDDSDISKYRDDTRRLVGAVTAIEQFKSKKGYRVTIEDLTGAREVTVFNSCLEGKEELLALGNIVGVLAKVEIDTFAQARAQEQAELAEGEEGGEGEAVEIPVSIKALQLFSWQPEQIPDSELRSEEEAQATLPTVSEKLLAEVAPATVASSTAEPGLDLETTPAELERELATVPVGAASQSPAAAQLAEVPKGAVPNAPLAPEGEPQPSLEALEAEIDRDEHEVGDSGSASNGNGHKLSAAELKAALGGTSSQEPAHIEAEQEAADEGTLAHPGDAHYQHAAEHQAQATGQNGGNGGNGSHSGGADDAPEKLPPFIRIAIEPAKFSAEIRNQLKAAFDESPGTVPVKIVIGDKTYGGINVNPTPALREAVRQILHPSA